MIKLLSKCGLKGQVNGNSLEVDVDFIRTGNLLKNICNHSHRVGVYNFLTLLQFSIKFNIFYQAKLINYIQDILHPIDLAEDIGIAYGYNKIENRIPGSFTVGT